MNPTSEELAATRSGQAMFGQQGALRRASFAAALLSGGLIAFGLVLFTLSRRNGLYGLTEYDDGVNFATAMRLVSGKMPYRDFVFVEPPGITVLMAPLALIGRAIGSREALALARLLTAVVAGANAVLIAWVLRFRGKVAMFVAGVTFGLYPTAFIADRTLELEPYLDLFCLLGVVALFSNGKVATGRKILLAGVMFGIAGAMKPFAIVPVMVIVVGLAIRHRRALVDFLAGVVIGFAVLCLPFFAASPQKFFHDVIVSQLGRQTLARADLPTRLSALTGIADAVTSIRHFGPHDELPLKIGLVITVIVVAGALVPALVRRGPAFEVFALASCVASIAAILIAAPFYDHYTYFSEMFLSMVFGIVAANAALLVRRWLGPSRSALRRRLHLSLGAASLLGAAICAGALIASESSYAASVMAGDGDPGPAIAQFIPKGACAISDAASLLVVANRLVSSDPSCPNVIDATGTWIAADPNHPPLRCRCGPPEPQLTAQWQTWLSQAQYAIFSGVHTFRIPWTAELDAWFAAHYRRVPKSHLPIFERIGATSTATAAK